MAKNTWLEFISEYKKDYPKMKYSDLLAQAADSPEWAKYKKSKKKSLITGCVDTVLNNGLCNAKEPDTQEPETKQKIEINQYIELMKEIELLKKEMKKFKHQ